MAVKRKDNTTLLWLREAGLVVIIGIVALWLRELDISFLARYAVVVLAVTVFSAVLVGISSGALIEFSPSFLRNNPMSHVIFYLALGLIGAVYLMYQVPVQLAHYWHLAHQQPLDPRALTGGLLKLWVMTYLLALIATDTIVNTFRYRRHLLRGEVVDAPAREE